MRRFLNRETLLYVAFGLLTTLLNYGVFYLCYHPLGWSALAANFLAFAAAVLFAFAANKFFVFRSKSLNAAALLREFFEFIGARLLTFLIEEAGLWLSEGPLALGRYRLQWGALSLDGVMAAKLALAIVVVLINYFLCKLLIFKKK